VEQKEGFQIFLGTKRRKKICSKNFQITGKQTGSKVIKQQKNREKTKVRFTFGTNARWKGFDQKKNEVLTMLPSVKSIWSQKTTFPGKKPYVKVVALVLKSSNLSLNHLWDLLFLRNSDFPHFRFEDLDLDPDPNSLSMIF